MIPDRMGGKKRGKDIRRRLSVDGAISILSEHMPALLINETCAREFAYRLTSTRTTAATPTDLCGAEPRFDVRLVLAATRNAGARVAAALETAANALTEEAARIPWSRSLADTITLADTLRAAALDASTSASSVPMPMGPPNLAPWRSMHLSSLSEFFCRWERRARGEDMRRYRRRRDQFVRAAMSAIGLRLPADQAIPYPKNSTPP